MKIAWDSDISPNDVNVFLKWFRDLFILKDVSRCMIINSTSELHVFVDASKEAYAACVFSFFMDYKFANNCTLLNEKCKDSEPSKLEIENSEKKLIRLVQSYYLPDAKSSNYIETYIDDEDILRVKTKIPNRVDERSFLYPILLPEKCMSSL
ncbi:integrase catalytic domain-containing protein [Trichonephila clavipes]|nr:integrase catalytic domain-containing protein [Trichonephila clavipes]